MAALGDAFGPNAERGVYRSRDGGQRWQKILDRGPDAGSVDLSMDPLNPRILFAAFRQARRNFRRLNSGGPGSGLFRSLAGGDTRQELTGGGTEPNIKNGMTVRGLPAGRARQARRFGLGRAGRGFLRWSRPRARRPACTAATTTERGTRQMRLVNVWPEESTGVAPRDLKYRFAWAFLLVFSSHDPKTLDAGSNRIFRTRDEGRRGDGACRCRARQARCGVGGEGAALGAVLREAGVGLLHQGAD